MGPRALGRRSAQRCAAWTRSCGSTSQNGAGRPAAGASPTSSPGVHRKVPGTSRLGGGGGGHRPERGRVVLFALLPRPWQSCPREEWCVLLSARAIATVIRSCLSHERSRRCFRRCAAPELGCSLGSIRKGDANKDTLGIDGWWWCCCCWCLVLGWLVGWYHTKQTDK